MSADGKRVLLEVKPGMNPVADSTEYDTMYFVDGNNVRFMEGRFEKELGWMVVLNSGAKPIKGALRSIYSFTSNTTNYYLLGTSSKLYAYSAGDLTNITPLKTTSTALANNPITTNGTNVVSVAYTSHGLAQYDRVKISGATGPVSGIPASDFNKEFEVNSVTDANTFTIRVATTAAGSTSGGGAAVVVFKEIDGGAVDESYGLGFGGGLFGVGLFGVPKSFSTATKPRIWSFDRFGENVVLTPGNQMPVYLWALSTTTAPVTPANAPTACEYVFVSDASIGALGAGGDYNKVNQSAQGDSTVWSPLSTNSAYEDRIEEASKFISSINVRGVNLLFTETGVWRHEFVGSPKLWNTTRLDVSDGIIARNARVEYNGTAYFMGQSDIYYFDGASVQATPANTLKKKVFDNYLGTLNRAQKSKIVAGLNPNGNEIIFYLPSGTASENSFYIGYNVKTGEYRFGTRARSAYEHPRPLTDTPFLAAYDGSNSTLYRHESGLNDDGAALPWNIETSYANLLDGNNTFHLQGLVVDGTLEGEMKVTVYTKLDPFDDSERTFGPFTFNDTTRKVNFRAHGRIRKYKFEQDARDTLFRGGRIYEIYKEGTPR